jgi:hypothetical protein
VVCHAFQRVVFSRKCGKFFVRMGNTKTSSLLKLRQTSGRNLKIYSVAMDVRCSMLRAVLAVCVSFLSYKWH